MNVAVIGIQRRSKRSGWKIECLNTVAPDTTQNVVQPILERESGLKAGSPHPPAPSSDPSA